MSKHIDSKIKPIICTSRKIIPSLVSRGYNEIKSYSFLPKEYQEKFVSKQSINIIQNPISEDKAEMRTSLIPSLVKTYQYNSNRQHNNVKIFEIGNIYQRDSKGKIVETNNIAGLISGQSSEASLKLDSTTLDFYDLKGDLISILPTIIFNLKPYLVFS